MRVRQALNDLLRRTEQMEGWEVGEMYLGPEIFIARLRQPRVLEGDWSEVDRTVDLFDLIDHYQKEGRTNSSRTINRNESSSLIFPGRAG
jgi:hypothetical protein